MQVFMSLVLTLLSWDTRWMHWGRITLYLPSHLYIFTHLPLVCHCQESWSWFNARSDPISAVGLCPSREARENCFKMSFQGKKSHYFHLQKVGLCRVYFTLRSALANGKALFNSIIEIRSAQLDFLLLSTRMTVLETDIFSFPLLFLLPSPWGRAWSQGPLKSVLLGTSAGLGCGHQMVWEVTSELPNTKDEEVGRRPEDRGSAVTWDCFSYNRCLNFYESKTHKTHDGVRGVVWWGGHRCDQGSKETGLSWGSWNGWRAMSW